MRKVIINLVTACSLSMGFSLLVNVAHAAVEQNEEKTEAKATKRVPALRAKVYSQLARAQALADEGKSGEAIEALDTVHNKKSSMNSYEVAMMHNFYAFIYYNQENYSAAIKHFKSVVAEDAIPESLRLSTLYSLAQLAMMAEDYDLSIQYLTQWMAAAGDKVNARSYVLLAQAHYAKKDYQAALAPLQQAIDLTEANQQLPEENWLVLQRAIYYELKQPAKVAEILERMVQLFDKPEYWLQLSNMYGELEQEMKQMATMETAYQRGFVTKRSDLLTLSQLYVFNRVPYKGAQLLQKAIDDGVVEETTQNLKFIAQSLVMAREEKAAIPILAKAASLADDGNLDAELAQTLMNIQDFEGAIAAAEKALQKGQLDRPGITHLVLGMSYYNLKKFNEAIVAFESASSFKESQKMANQWTGYVRREAQTEMQLAQAGL